MPVMSMMSTTPMSMTTQVVIVVGWMRGTNMGRDAVPLLDAQLKSKKQISLALAPLRNESRLAAKKVGLKVVVCSHPGELPGTNTREQRSAFRYSPGRG